jgi:thiol-disulfide isomerase/thioredoxin
MLIKLTLFLIALGAGFLLIRWRTRVATQKLLQQTIPDGAIDLPPHPDGLLLLFHQPHCGPCREISESFDSLAVTAPGRALKINVTEQLELARHLGIRATPTTLLIRDNTVDAAFIGPLSLQKLQGLLKLTP